MKELINKELYSLGEIYKITYRAFLTARKLTFARKEKHLNKQFTERIMLAVTEVNDCPACSYGHTKISLEAKMSANEIENMLSGDHSDVPGEQLVAIMFAQHYADYFGEPTKKAWDQLVKFYGKEKAEGVLGAVRMIMLGNAYGITWGSFINRFKGKPDVRSNLLYEVAIVVASATFIPVALAHSLLANFVGTELISFEQ